MEEKNIIDVCVGILPKSLQNIYYKYEEKWLYVLFGGLTTLVSMITKLVPFMLIPGTPFWENTVVVIFSWICAVTFAFFTNKKYVFKNETHGRAEFQKVFISFYASRLATLLMEWLIFTICCNFMGINEKIITLISQFVIFIANYVLSKLFVFRKKDSTESSAEK